MPLHCPFPATCSNNDVIDSETVHSVDSQGSSGGSPAPSPSGSSESPAPSPAGGAGGPAPSAGPGAGGEAPLPAGKVLLAVTASRQAVRCQDYAPDSTWSWVTDSASPSWWGTGAATADALDVQASLGPCSGRHPPCMLPLHAACTLGLRIGQCQGIRLRGARCAWRGDANAPPNCTKLALPSSAVQQHHRCGPPGHGSHAVSHA